MNLINGTLIVQAFNFLLAYLILRFLLLKPVVAYIQQEAARKRALQLSVESLTVGLQVQEQEKAALWAQCLQQFRATVPHAAVDRRSDKRASQALNDGSMTQRNQLMTPEQEAHMISEVAQQLIKGIVDARG
jgi:hypothetical protein